MLNIISLTKFPIPKIEESEQKYFVDIVEKIMEYKAENKDTKELESEIDKIVYSLYGLSKEEIEIIEKKIL